MVGSISWARARHSSWRCPADRDRPVSATGREVAVGHRGHEVVGADGPRRQLDLEVGGLRAAVGDVRPDGAREQERLLGHVADVAAVRVEVDVAQVDAVDEDPAAGGVVEAGDELDERRLAGARGADEGHALAGRDVQVDPAQRLGGLGGVGEAHTLQLHVADPRAGLDGVGPAPASTSAWPAARRGGRARRGPGSTGRTPPTAAAAARRTGRGRAGRRSADPTSAVPWPIRRAPYQSTSALANGAQQLAAGEVDRHQLHRAQAGVAVLHGAGGEPRGVVVARGRATG